MMHLNVVSERVTNLCVDDQESQPVEKLNKDEKGKGKGAN
jgi:hypothetical protein